MIEKYKDRDDLLLVELNVKQLARPLGVTDRGELELVYDRDSRQYFWRLGGERVVEETPKLDGDIPDILRAWWRDFGDSTR